MVKSIIAENSFSLTAPIAKASCPGSFRRLYVVLDGTFTLNDGKAASYNMDHAFFQRYSHAFDEIVVVARKFDKEDSAARPVEGGNVRFEALPSYQGPVRFLRAFPKVFMQMLRIARDKEGTVMVRTPSTAGNMMGHFMVMVGRPYGIELVGDPVHAYSKESLKHPLARLFQWMFTSSCKFLCRRSETASYVTRDTLQRDYPPGPKTRAFHYTSLDLPKEGYVQKPRKAESFQTKEPRLVQVAMMQNWYKGHDISLELMAELKKRGRPMTLRLVGDGTMRAAFEDRAKDLGIEDQIEFVGQLKAGEEIWQELDQSDMLILPSRQEGLPRVVIEAMARGLPVVSNRIGGAPELLDDAQLIDDLSASQFADRIEATMADPDLLARQSKRNLDVAHRYNQTAVQKRRDACYHALKYQLTAEAQYI